MTAEARRVVAALKDAGIEPVLLKGLDCARFYPEPGVRTFQDLDLFVVPGDAARAGALLAALGFHPGPLRDGRRRDWTAPGFAIHSLEFSHASSGWGVDLHQGLGRVYHRALIAELPSPEPTRCPLVDLEGFSVRVLAPACRVALLTLHASSSLRALQLTRLLDIRYAAAATTPDAWAALVVLMRQAGSIRFAYPALALTERLAPGCVPRAVIEAIAEVTPRRLRRATSRIPLTGLQPGDRWDPGYAFLWAATLRDAISVMWHQASRQ